LNIEGEKYYTNSDTLSLMDQQPNSIKLHLKNDLGIAEELPFQTTVNVYPKGHNMISPGEVEKRLNFLISGIVETRIIGINGNEKITEFFFPNSFFCSLSSFLNQKPTDVYMTCLTDCVIESISYNDYFNALETSLVVNIFGRKIAENSYLLRIKREKDMLTKSAGERYLELMKKRPEVMQQIALSKIALYLGIHPRSLSRIRRDVF
jgi:CRP-like cAMP-binding protein